MAEIGTYGNPEDGPGVSRLSGTTGAKVVAPEYVPIVVQKAEFDAVRKYLGGLSFDTAAPIMVFLNDAEAKAKAQWEADHEPKKPEPAKKP